MLGGTCDEVESQTNVMQAGIQRALSVFLEAVRVGVTGTAYLVCAVEELAVPELRRCWAFRSPGAGEEFHVLGLSGPFLGESVRNLASP